MPTFYPLAWIPQVGERTRAARPFVAYALRMADLAPLFYDLVRRLVDRTGSQTTVAHATGLSTSYISKIIRNEVGPDIRPTTVAGALSALGYTVDDLVNGVDIDIPTTVPGQARKAGRKHRKAPRRAPSFAEGDDVEVIRFRDQPHLFMDFISETIDTENAPMVLILALAR